MISVLELCRIPWHIFHFRLSCRMLIPIFLQPILVSIMSFCSRDSVPLVSFELAAALLIFIFYTKRGSRHELLYYWVVSSITYVIIVFENIVVPLSEIESQENLLLGFFIALSFLFLNCTKTLSHRNSEPGAFNGDILSSNISLSSCPICKVKINARSYHCSVCQTCVPKYDFHCYWLNCCIGENNQHFFVLALLFCILSLGYGSLLILTTICEPEYILGVLLPRDCSDVDATAGMFTSFIAGLYCMELTVILLIQFIHQVWLISSGHSAAEWKEQWKYNIFKTSPYSMGFVNNWYMFFQRIKNIKP